MSFVGGAPNSPVGVAKTAARQEVYRGNLSVKNIGSYRELMAKGTFLPGGPPCGATSKAVVPATT